MLSHGAKATEQVSPAAMDDFAAVQLSLFQPWKAA